MTNTKKKLFRQREKQAPPQQHSPWHLPKKWQRHEEEMQKMLRDVNPDRFEELVQSYSGYDIIR